MQPEQLVQSFLMGSKHSQSGLRRLELLTKIDSLGSLSAAASASGLSYKGAWQAVEAMNQLVETPLVESQKGGAGGGGMVLTPEGKALVSAYQLFNEKIQHWMRELSDTSPELLGQLDVMRRIALKTSARNLFYGTIISIEKTPVNCEVILKTPQGFEVVSQITPSSLERLGLKEGAQAYALIKANWVVLSTLLDRDVKISARNHYCGEIVHIENGPVNAEVTIALEGGQQISATVTEKSVEAMGLMKGGACCALVKASHVLLAVSD